MRKLLLFCGVLIFHSAEIIQIIVFTVFPLVLLERGFGDLFTGLDGEHFASFWHGLGFATAILLTIAVGFLMSAAITWVLLRAVCGSNAWKYFQLSVHYKMAMNLRYPSKRKFR